MEEELKEVSERINREMGTEESKILRDLVVGFLVVKSKVSNGYSYINMIPLDSSWDGFNDDHEIDADEEIVGVIPAPQGSYKVLVLLPSKDEKEEYPVVDKYVTFGYYYVGAYRPDWKKLLDEKIKDKELNRIKNEELNRIRNEELNKRKE